MLSKILVTGGTGFLGSYIIKELIEHGYSVRAIRRLSSVLPHYISKDILDKVEWVEGDILDIVSLEEAMEGIDTVIHAAATVSFSKKDRAKMYQVNVDGTINVINIALEKNITRFVYISSIAALGRTVTGSFVDEEKKWENSKANTHYGKSKYKAELEVWRGMGEGLNAVILNPGTILGYGDWNTTSNTLFKRVYNGFKWYTSGINGFVGVKDVAKATRIAMESPIHGERFVLVSENWPFRKLQDTIAEGLHRPKPTKEASPSLLNIAWRIEAVKSFFTGKHPLLTKETARIGVSQTQFKNDKFLKTFVDFQFTPLDKTISEACRLYLADIKQ